MGELFLTGPTEKRRQASGRASPSASLENLNLGGLIERGVQFIEISHNLNFLFGTGWDVHNEGIVIQHKLIAELDQALLALVLDLETKKLLDSTLIVVATEFGRPAQFDGGGEPIRELFA